MGTGAAFWFNGYAPGRGSSLAGFCLLLSCCRLVRNGDRRIGAPALQQEGRRVVPLEHELVHLQRGHVLRRVLRRAVLHPRDRRSRTSASRHDRRLLWPNFAGAVADRRARTSSKAFSPMAAIGIPLLNTIILVSSGGTLTVAHHALKAGHRGALKFWLFVTIALGRDVPRVPGVSSTRTPTANSTSSCRPASTDRRSSC